MFQSARLKLTAWYLLIIMIVSILFSIAIYNVATREIHRVVRMQQLRQDYYDNFFPAPPPQELPTIEDLQGSEGRLALTLALVNASILILAGGAAYFLAGRTLNPIKKMVDEQNRFVADASHELRTPLTSLRAEMEANLLDEKINAKDARQLIQSNLEDVMRLQSLSDNLLQLAQYRKTNNKPTMKDVPIIDVIKEAVKKVTPSAKQKDIKLTQDVTDLILKGEQQSISQLLVILLDNAIKYSPMHTSIDITVSKADHMAKISVADKGMGIDEKDIPHIFDRFYRADKSRTKTDTSGYGLGLSIAKMITEMHHGTIEVKSQLGKGTAFFIHLPLK